MEMTTKKKTRVMVTGLMLLGTAGIVAGIHNVYTKTDSGAAGSTQLGRSEDPSAHGEFEALKNEIIQLKRDKQDLKNKSRTNSQELALLKSQFALLVKEVEKESVEILQEIDLQEQASQTELTPEQMQQRVDDMLESHVALIEETLQTEAPDPQWSGTAQQSLHEAFHSANIHGVTLEDAVCQTTLCRLKFNFDAQTSSDEGFRALQDAVPWEAAGFSRIDDETGEIEVYLAREGHDLPKYAMDNHY